MSDTHQGFATRLIHSGETDLGDAVPLTTPIFETTTFVASCDQVFGISTSCCSNTTSPFSPLMTALLFSHSTVE